MDRDRTRPRDFQDQYGTGRGESYRPGNRSPPLRADTYRARSPPPRRADYGDSYRNAPRPRSRSPLRHDDFRRRSPGRFGEPGPLRGGDSYRVRPRSPISLREDLPRDDLFRREPPRDYPDERVDRVIRDDRDRGYSSRSPLPRFRDRSPLPLKRTRESSPVGSRGRRSPPPAKRERLASPPRSRYDDYPNSRAASPPRRRYSPEPSRERRLSPPRGVTRDYRLRSRSPLARNDRVDPRSVDDWRRPRSPSLPRYGRQDYISDDAARTSGSNSRRPSPPPVHSSRLAPLDDRPARLPPTDSYDNREPYRARSPERRRESPQTRPRERDYPDERDYSVNDDRIPPPREPYRNDDNLVSRVPPSGPSNLRNSTTMAPPTAPVSTSVTLQTRAPAVSPPSGPRGTAPPSAPRGHTSYGNDYAPRGRGGFNPGFRGRGGGPVSGFGRGDGFSRDQQDFNSAPPSGPRGSAPLAAKPPFPTANNTTSTTYARTQRFGPNGQPIPEGAPSGLSANTGVATGAPPTGPKAQRRPTDSPVDNRRPSELTVDFRRPSMDTRRPPEPPTQPRQTLEAPVRPRGPAGPHPAIASFPVEVPGGVPPAPLVDTSRVQKLQQEAERLRHAIDEREQKKRKSLREWDRLSRDTEQATFRSQLAEEGLQKLELDGRVSGAGEAGW
ncbi:Hypothetical protein R9X50_00694200 [Acrodontium crateriforme]|uniref:Uncharacterized protein n=1 Tax=Acrodontium crateriforme TaxID=150365 RepID=A0AAQ3MBR8_9PEZI|nr:Hypothetical protein R9X50_00694200 [Acrodontium crateriforme]